MKKTYITASLEPAQRGISFVPQWRITGSFYGTPEADVVKYADSFGGSALEVAAIEMVGYNDLVSIYRTCLLTCRDMKTLMSSNRVIGR